MITAHDMAWSQNLACGDSNENTDSRPHHYHDMAQ